MPVIPKAAKQVGGRFPAIEAKMDAWMDEQIAMGQDIRDNMARDKAKDIAREIGFPIDRFKASAKWYDKVSAVNLTTGLRLTLSSRRGGSLRASPTHLPRSRTTCHTLICRIRTCSRPPTACLGRNRQSRSRPLIRRGRTSINPVQGNIRS